MKIRQKPKSNTLVLTMRVGAIELERARDFAESHGLDFNQLIREKLREISNLTTCPTCNQPIKLKKGRD